MKSTIKNYSSNIELVLMSILAGTKHLMMRNISAARYFVEYNLVAAKLEDAIKNALFSYCIK